MIQNQLSFEYTISTINTKTLHAINNIVFILMNLMYILLQPHTNKHNSISSPVSLSRRITN